MVFYTPYMVTVATKLDVPIKLTFQAAERKSILGLGDIVIPGMVMALALRFDLWRHYEGKIKYESTDLKLIEKDPSSLAVYCKYYDLLNKY
jgi:minor histocompatibility antigen H13